MPLSQDIKQGLRIETPQGQFQIDVEGKVRVSGGCIVMRSDSADEGFVALWVRLNHHSPGIQQQGLDQLQ